MAGLQNFTATELKGRRVKKKKGGVGGEERKGIKAGGAGG